MPAPKKPAVQSGPGALSQRTDGGPASKQAVRYMAGGDYGDGQDMINIQSSAAMAQAAPVRSVPPSAIAQAASGQEIIPLNAPTTEPGQPVTHGADGGPGPGMDSLGLNTGDVLQNNAFKEQLASYMPALMFIANRETTSPETRNIIRQLRENM